MQTDRRHPELATDVDPFEAVPGYDDALFCYHCGHMLDGAVCVSCGGRWTRLRTLACVGCGGTRTHLLTPYYVRLDHRQERVVSATGPALCECGAGMVYRWDREGAEPALTLIGFDYRGEPNRVQVGAQAALAAAVPA